MRYFLAAGHVPGAGARGHGLEEGLAAGTFTTLLARQLRAQGVDVVNVPDALDLRDTVTWINARARPGDRAIELHFNAAGSDKARGCMVAYGSAGSIPWARAILRGLNNAGVPTWSRGLYPHTEVASWRGWSRLWFPYATGGVLVELAFLTNAADAALFKDPTDRAKIAATLAAELAGRKRLYRPRDFFTWAGWRVLGRPGERPAGLRRRIPSGWWAELKRRKGVNP